MHGEITLRLKSELEKCVTSNSQKRGLISKLKDELRVAKEEIATLKERCQRAEKNAEEYQVNNELNHILKNFTKNIE